MAICPVCGCKTDELDFIKSSVNGVEKNVCSFCDRQLKTFSGDEVNPSAVRWLTNVLGKEVERDEETLGALKSLYEKYGNSANAVPNAMPKVNNAVAQQNHAAKISASDFDDKDRVISQLVKRVEKLEKDLVQMKRKQMIKTIVELGLPFVMLIILVIIFLSSGLLENIGMLFDMAGVEL